MNRVEYARFFHSLACNQPHKFQEELASTLLDEKSVLLQAPTGSGKTWAAVAPFVYAQEKGISFPRKLIYSLPIRTLTNSLHSTMKTALIKHGFSGRVAIQTGENTEDHHFEGDIIFTTIDQSLSSFLEFPLSLPQRMANINAGAVVGSYLVFDEFHLFDIQRAFATTINILKKLRGVAPFCLMTATLSKTLIQRIAAELNAVIIEVDDGEMGSLKSQKTSKYLKVDTAPLTASNIEATHKRRTIVICNTVERCQEVFLALKQKQNNSSASLFKEAELICIHSRFFGKDRKEKEEKIKSLFCQGSSANAILVSTQVVEVGLDISCSAMHTEVSPINSFVQRIGRCARYENEQGEIYVYPPKPDDRGNVHYYPYESTGGGKDICELTFTELNAKNGTQLGYSVANDLIDCILSKQDTLNFADIKAADGGFRQDTIKRAMADKEKRYSTELIREINTVNVGLCSEYRTVSNPYNYETVSIGYYSLHSKLKKLEEAPARDPEEDWLVAKVQPDNFLDLEEAEGSLRYTLKKSSLDEVKYEPLFFLNTKHVRYSSDIGLNFLGEGNLESQFKPKREQLRDYRLKKDTFRQHTEALIKCYESEFQHQLHFTLEQIRKRFNASINFDELVKFMIVLHDYGKLNKEWQRIAHEYQSRKPNYDPAELLAHTDFGYTEEDAGILRMIGRFPTHAGIGALISLSLLEDLIPDELLMQRVGRAVATSIIEHHSVNSKNTSAYEIGKREQEEMFSLMQTWAAFLSGFDRANKVLGQWRRDNLQDYLVSFDDTEETLLYLILVRVLRLCDQKSFSYLQQQETN